MKTKIKSVIWLVLTCFLPLTGNTQNTLSSFKVPNSYASWSYHNICDTNTSIDSDGLPNKDAVYLFQIYRPAILIVNNAGSELQNTYITEHQTQPPVSTAIYDDALMFSETEHIWSSLPASLRAEIEADGQTIVREQVFYCKEVEFGSYRIVNEGDMLRYPGGPNNGRIKTNIYVYYLGGSMAEAIDCGTMDAPFSYAKQIGTSIRQSDADSIPIYFRFTLSQSQVIAVKNKSGNGTKLSLLDSIGQCLDVSGNYPLLGGTSPQIVSHKLSAGTYYVVSTRYAGINFTTTTITGEIPQDPDPGGHNDQNTFDMGTITKPFHKTVSYDTSKFLDCYWGPYSSGRKDVYLKFTFPQDVEFVLSPDDAKVGGAIVTLLDRDEKQLQTITTHVYPNTSLYKSRLAAGTYFVVLEGAGSDGELGAEIRILPLNNLSDNHWEPSADMNYVVTMLPTYETSSPEHVSPRLSGTSINYYDHLGRPSQQNQYAASPNGNDIVVQQEYNVFGAVAKSYLPVDMGNTGAYNAVDNVRERGAALYKDLTPNQLTKYDDTPLMRVVEQYGPGQLWRNAGKFVKTQYDLNADSIICFAVSGIRSDPKLIRNTGYAPKSLFVISITDEDGHPVHKFMDINGRNILTRVETGRELLDTYSVYDDYGNLCFVLPPMTDAANITAAELEKFAYMYRYDYRNRCIASKIPGAQWVYSVYDYANNLVLQQDGESRSRSEWNCMLYDKFKRLVVSGVYKGVVDEKSINGQILSATYDRTGNYGYSLNGLRSDSLDVLTVTYYDSYDFKSFLPDYNADLDYTSDDEYGKWYNHHDYNAKGLVTGSVMTVLGENKHVLTVTYYDNNKRPVQVRATTPDGGSSLEKYRYDFVGNVLKSCEIHQPTPDMSPDVVVRENEYDKMGRKLSSRTTVNGGTPAIVTYGYDDIGRLISTTQGDGADSIRTERKYNIRGWLTEQNNDLFSMQLKYTDPEFATPSYSGNIMEWSWRNGAQSAEQTYAFTYDALSRLTETHQYEDRTRTDRNVERGLSYDRNGNILSLCRYADGQVSASYSYRYNGNQLACLDTPDAVDSGAAFQYDNNGNMIYDALRCRNLRYNRLNLLEKVFAADTTYANYRYLASGTKLSVGDSAGNGFVYQGSLVYRSQEGAMRLESAVVDGGRIVASHTAGGTSYTPHYYVSDHLGSTRAISDGTSTNRIWYDYYPFGKQWSNPEMQITDNRYLFNGKEWQPIGGVNLLDYTARMYDPELVIWGVPDQMCGIYPQNSPYLFCYGNPLRFIDPDGRFPYKFDWKTRQYIDIAGNPVSWGEVGDYIKNSIVEIGNLVYDFSNAVYTPYLDAMANSSNMAVSITGLMGEFVTGFGAESREFGADHVLTKSLKDSNMTKVALKQFWKSYSKGGNPTHYMVDWGPVGLFYETGAVADWIKDGGFSAPQFIGTATYHFAVDGGNLNISVKDDKNEYSFLLHLPGTDRHTRAENRFMGKTNQTYTFSIPLSSIPQLINR